MGDSKERQKKVRRDRKRQGKIGKDRKKLGKTIKSQRETIEDWQKTTKKK